MNQDLTAREPRAATGGVVVVGAVNVDFVVTADRLPTPGETVVGPGAQRFGGGKGANAAVAAARSGATVRLVGAVGDDEIGRSALSELRGDGVDVSGVAVDTDRSTGVALIVVDKAGENQIAVGAGANAAVDPGHVRDVVAGASAGCVLVSTEISPDAVIAAVEAAIERGLPCILNPAPVVPAVFSVLGLGALLTPNAGELAALAAGCPQTAPPEGEGRLGAVTADARRVVGCTGAPVVVTMGGDGALVVHPDGSTEHVPAPAAEVRDTTGAGDTFNGVLATRLSQGRSLAEAVRAAVAAASLAVGHIGARTGMPTTELVDAALARA